VHGVAFEGATQLTNNTAELTAFLEALRWVAEVDVASDAPVIVRPDSMYAAMTITGVWPAKGPNYALIMAARAMLSRVEAAGREVWVTRVRAHTAHAWNDRADRLAARGAAGWASGVGHTWSQWPAAAIGAGTRVQGPHDGSPDQCFLCLEAFVDADRPTLDASLPTPAGSSRAPPTRWRCQHAPCRGCVQEAQRYDRCPVCRQPCR